MNMIADKHAIAAQCAESILDAYRSYYDKYRAITRRARGRFVEMNWEAAQRDTLERLDLYPRIITDTVSVLEGLLGQSLGDGAVMAEIRHKFALLAESRLDWELSATFFNSVVRRVDHTIGVNDRLEFTADDFNAPLIEDRSCPICEHYYLSSSADNIRQAVMTILKFYQAEIPFENIGRDAAGISRRIEACLLKEAQDQQIEVIIPIFYRDRAAYIIGRIRSGSRITPLVIALLSSTEGAYTDAVLLSNKEISILFSYTRSYFHVLVDNPSEMVNFLMTINPHKRVSEIYTSIGYHKHGKSELYREFIRNLDSTKDKFEIARGEKGMVMLVFTLPSFNVVFKVIRDSFGYPKTTNRERVRKRYSLVFRHDRAGRLVDAQEFEYLKFPRSRFSQSLLKELQKSAGRSVEIRERHVIIRHLYTERRVTPLDVYIRENGPEAISKVVEDYGRAIKELAATNIFTGDLFLKNFGVTRYGRVVFYDYDEICLIKECKFRKMPQARTYEEALSAEPWFYVDDHDVFPEEFRTFLKFPPQLQRVFEDSHGDLFRVDFWRTIQDELDSGLTRPIIPYAEMARL